MKKFFSILSVIIFASIFLPGCATKRDFCECVDLTKAVTDQYMLSENEKIKKEKECKWIQEELSPAEILQKTAECWGANTAPSAENTDEQQISATPDSSASANPQEMIPDSIPQ
jgi:hypothetical protein